ncbi:hypothetical protein ACRFZU_000522 [Escherichia coli]|uniref:hypothetical protein n=1 Tax=Enterobacter hormaechei TaxID=158836 RepID=UPI00080A87B8|nr:hypothetical protein [Enterobacter hormaechei]HCI6795723.1 hypothetical protein [Klebsiella quasipneumoniae subsp. quasipneumoniae]HDR2890516.1 hypothetical protein [Enterobacter asburiae]
MLNNALISEYTLTDNVPQFQNQTWSGETITRIVGTQYFTLSFKVTINKNNRQELANFYANYTNSKPFDMSLGWWGDYNGRQTGAVQATAARNAGATSIAVNTNSLEVGSLIQFGGHKKLYRIIANTGTTMTIFPGLIRSVQGGEVINYDNLKGSFILVPSQNGYNLPSTNVMEVTIQATENIRG